MRILLTGGGTGGHLFPLLSVAEAIKKESSEPIEFLYLGPCNKFSDAILKQNGIKTKNVLTAKWRRYFSLLNLVDAIKLPFGIIQALAKVLLFMPDVVFSKGGYGSVPVVIAARIYWIPIVIHESDAVPGRANRFMEHLSDAIAVSYKMTENYTNPVKTFFSGNPVREKILGQDVERAKAALGIKTEKPTLLILGGSQGAQNLNEVIAKILPRLLNTYEVIHQCGENNYEETKNLAGQAGVKIGREGYYLFPFLSDAKEEVKNALAAADLVLSRAGASAVAEIAAYKKPSILVPLRGSANDHQLHNAFEVAKEGGAMALKEENMTPELLLGKIDILMNDAPLRKTMGEKAYAFYYPDAAKIIAQSVLKLGNKEKLRD
ncbi:MAG: undecaprenyldiphospho-muramoylpentapeptide beta-N-acetylglucosaminyltransferase [Candidatus Moranbacteria bacterium]|nr:undecaprenyldiphospho-muramoylpentapeptide beta-N-acetylglucosaminyltransferase [Candidatus Moranbacteria bacterium]